MEYGNDMEALRGAFKELTKVGYRTRFGRGCCNSCIGAEIAQSLTKAGVPEEEWKGVFFSRQSRDSFTEDGNLRDCIYLCWDAPRDDATEICDVIEANGLKVERPATSIDAIKVMPLLTMEEKQKAKAKELADVAARKYREADAEMERLILVMQEGACQDAYDAAIRLRDVTYARMYWGGQLERESERAGVSRFEVMAQITLAEMEEVAA